MDEHQDKHLAAIERRAWRLLRTKYTRGAKEHKNYIWDLSEMDLVDNAIEEAIDQLVYLLTLRDKVEARELRRS